MVRKDAWYDFDFLIFTNARLVVQYVVNIGECSMCTWEKCVFVCFLVEFSKNINQVQLSKVSFKGCVSLLIFYLDDLSVDESRVLKSPTIIVLLSISPLIVVSICLYVLWCSFVGCIYIYNCCIFFLDWSLGLYVLSFLVSCKSFIFFLMAE